MLNDICQIMAQHIVAILQKFGQVQNKFPCALSSTVGRRGQLYMLILSSNFKL